MHITQNNQTVLFDEFAKNIKNHWISMYVYNKYIVIQYNDENYNHIENFILRFYKNGKKLMNQKTIDKFRHINKIIIGCFIVDITNYDVTYYKGIYQILNILMKNVFQLLHDNLGLNFGYFIRIILIDIRQQKIPKITLYNQISALIIQYYKYKSIIRLKCEKNMYKLIKNIIPENFDLIELDYWYELKDLE